ncbi:uncharacterized protein [Vulpes vulpes]|uniref:Uncharacterized protein isoform X1 n=1 Tax=Vulpes vulpes TaxID=9627 RepID=A0ABM4ZMR7_VULVU
MAPAPAPPPPPRLASPRLASPRRRGTPSLPPPNFSAPRPRRPPPPPPPPPPRQAPRRGRPWAGPGPGPGPARRAPRAPRAPFPPPAAPALRASLLLPADSSGAGLLPGPRSPAPGRHRGSHLGPGGAAPGGAGAGLRRGGRASGRTARGGGAGRGARGGAALPPAAARAGTLSGPGWGRAHPPGPTGLTTTWRLQRREGGRGEAFGPETPSNSGMGEVRDGRRGPQIFNLVLPTRELCDSALAAFDLGDRGKPRKPPKAERGGIPQSCLKPASPNSGRCSGRRRLLGIQPPSIPDPKFFSYCPLSWRSNSTTLPSFPLFLSHSRQGPLVAESLKSLQKDV